MQESSMRWEEGPAHTADISHEERASGFIVQVSATIKSDLTLHYKNDLIVSAFRICYF